LADYKTVNSFNQHIELEDTRKGLEGATKAAFDMYGRQMAGKRRRREPALGGCQLASRGRGGEKTGTKEYT